MADVKKLPVWVFYVVILFVVSLVYSGFLFTRVTRLERDLDAKGGENSQTRMTISNLKNAHAQQMKELEQQITDIEDRMTKADLSHRKELEMVNNDSVSKLEEERNKYKMEKEEEVDRIIRYYQKRFKTAVTPPPPKNKK